MQSRYLGHLLHAADVTYSFESSIRVLDKGALGLPILELLATQACNRSTFFAGVCHPSRHQGCSVQLGTLDRTKHRGALRLIFSVQTCLPELLLLVLIIENLILNRGYCDTASNHLTICRLLVLLRSRSFAVESEFHADR